MEVVAEVAAYKKKEVANKEGAELRKCLSYDRCKLDCPDGGKMKTGKTEMGRRKRFCEKDGKVHELGPGGTRTASCGRSASTRTAGL